MAKSESLASLTLPALRGTFGSWVFYSCLMPIHDLGSRTEYAQKIHPAREEELSRFIQRALEGKRSVEIAKYLTGNEDRFFNSLVLAVYGGKPDWLEIGIQGAATSRASLAELSAEARDSIGFLRLTGSEKLFAIDGQHRLSGIKHAIENNMDLAEETVPVIFVGHANTTKGLRRTRRLFTTLNKTAVAVTKRDIIALDEDDVMAIIVRELYETDQRFGKPRTAITATSNLPATSPALTTIGNLYDILKLLFMHESGTTSRDTLLRFNRPSDERLAAYKKSAQDYFTALATHFPALSEYFLASDPPAVANKYRAKGGHILFRPIGLELVTRATIAMSKAKGISTARAVALIAPIEVRISSKPYTGVIWDADRNVVLTKGKTLARRLIFYTLGLPCHDETLLADYRAFLGGDESDKSIRLPARISRSVDG